MSLEIFNNAGASVGFSQNGFSGAFAMGYSEYIDRGGSLVVTLPGAVPVVTNGTEVVTNVLDPINVSFFDFSGMTDTSGRFFTLNGANQILDMRDYGNGSDHVLASSLIGGITFAMPPDNYSYQMNAGGFYGPLESFNLNREPGSVLDMGGSYADDVLFDVFIDNSGNPWTMSIIVDSVQFIGHPSVTNYVTNAILVTNYVPGAPLSVDISGASALYLAEDGVTIQGWGEIPAEVQSSFSYGIGTGAIVFGAFLLAILARRFLNAGLDT